MWRLRRDLYGRLFRVRGVLRMWLYLFQRVRLLQRRMLFLQRLRRMFRLRQRLFRRLRGGLFQLLLWKLFRKLPGELFRPVLRYGGRPGLITIIF